MNRILHLIIFSILFSGVVCAQGTDSVIIPHQDTLPVTDSAAIKDSLLALQMKDSVSRRPPEIHNWQMDLTGSFDRHTIDWAILQRHPYFGFSNQPLTFHSDTRHTTGKETIFYVLVLLLLLYALMRQAFPKYFNDLFRLFFRTTIKQRQISEQLMQTPLPSLLLNGFFVITAGLYINFLLQHYDLRPVENSWLLTLYCCIFLSLIYFIKFIALKVSGWIFNMKEAANAYIFVVFVVNKIIGIFLLPFLLMLAFMKGSAYSAALVFSWFGVGALIFYRLVLTYAAVRNQVKVNPFHFFLYLCAFEIAPLLLIYKGLLVIFQQTA